MEARFSSRQLFAGLEILPADRQTSDGDCLAPKGVPSFWSWKIRHGKRGRPAVSQDVRDLIRMVSRNHPLWGAPRIHGELLKLGIEITEPTVAKYMLRRSKPPSQTWRTFLENHVKSVVSLTFSPCRRSGFKSSMSLWCCHATAHSPVWGYRSSHSRMDGTATSQCLSVRQSAEVSTARPRSDLWKGFR
jgi:hypothetical protein